MLETSPDGSAPGEHAHGWSAREQRFDRTRRTLGLFLGPTAAILVWLLPFPSLALEAHRLAAIVALVVIWWITEPIAIPATALIGAALTVLTGVASAQDAFAPFASPTIFLFIGSFMIGKAVTEHGVDRRLALAILSWRLVRGSLARTVVALGALTSLVSAWMSNTATAAMMLPIALGVLGAGGLRGTATRTTDTSRTAPFLLAIAYCASIGGMMTPVGTPPNLITIGLLDKLTGTPIDFLTWMLLGVPISLALTAVTLAVSARRVGRATLASPAPAAPPAGARPPGRWTAGQRNCAIAFGVAVLLWVTPGVLALVLSPNAPVTRLVSARLDEAVVAIAAAGLLFLLPVDWRQRSFTLEWRAAADIDWGTILLFGGGLSLGRLMFVTGLAGQIGEAVVGMSGATSVWTITAVAVGLAIVLSEMTSNTAATSMLVPVVISICQAAHVNPVPAAVGAGLGASMGLMLPVATPPNAIAYGTGLIPITRMIRYGALLDVVGYTTIMLGLRVLCPLLGLA